MLPFSNFTAKAQEAIRKAHELAMERGQSQIDTLHLLAALILQDDGVVLSILDKLEVDVNFLTDAVLEELQEAGHASVAVPSFQVYLAPDLGRVIEAAYRAAQVLGTSSISTEHLFLGLFIVSALGFVFVVDRSLKINLPIILALAFAAW